MALQKAWLDINGARRMVIFDRETDTLAAVLRRLGLTGVKIGCGQGQCGACSVILNGQVVRSCVKKMRNVPEYSAITTIEGIGTPGHLHPLQVAWNTYGAVQCGFCSPGFIVSAKALLDENPAPSREQVRDWFAQHHNVCRCTGYHPIVDAVMAAAQVLRGELSIDDITYHVPADGKIYGTRFPRRETGVSRVTGLANYGDDIAAQMPPDMLFLAPVIPDTAHALLKSVDFSEAAAMPGVVRVVTAADVRGTNRIAIPTGHPKALATGMERPIIADHKIYKYGDAVAIVCADTREHARAAAKLVRVEFEPLPEYSQLEALLPDAIQIHEGVPNRFCTTALIKGEDTEPIMDSAPYVVEASFSSTREPHLTIEPDVVQAYVDSDDVLTVQYKSQYVYWHGQNIHAGVGYPLEKIRVIENETGGAFGYSCSSPTIALACVCALATGRPVSMTLSYAEHMHMTGKRTAMNGNVRMACDEQGHISGLEYHYSLDHGAYTEWVQNLLAKTHVFTGYGYKIPNARGISQACYSNFGFGACYRAFAAVQAFTAFEPMMDLMARKIGMDPFDFRYLNLVQPGELSINGTEYNEYPFQAMMDKARPKYKEAQRWAAAHSTADKKCGVGITLGGYAVGSPIDNAKVAIELMPDGTITNYNTWEDVGQHAESAALLHTYEALRPMNVPLEKIKLVMNDTALCPDTGLAGGSRLHYHGGNATIDGCAKLMAAMRKPDGSYRTYEEMVAEGIPTKYIGATSTPQGAANELDLNTNQGHMFAEMIYDLFMAVVTVDVKTGKTTVDRLLNISDIGVVGNVLGAEGQAYGGMAHSVGFALQEDYSDMKKHNNMLGAGILTIDQMPDDVELIFQETYRKNGPYGSGGASEGYQSAGHVAILNAIQDAVGVRIYELPARPEKVLAAMEAQAQGRELKPEKYYLGGELYDLLEELRNDPVPEDINYRFTGRGY